MKKNQIELPKNPKTDQTYYLISVVVHKLHQSGVDKQELMNFREDCLNGDYKNFVRLTKEYFTVKLV